MPRTCTICRHDKAREINQLIVNGDAIRGIAKRYGASPSSLERHRNSCLARKLIAAKELERGGNGPDLISRLREIHAETGAILTLAKKAKDWRLALQAITRLERQVELEAELLGQLERGGRAGETTVMVQYVDRQIMVAPGHDSVQLPAPAEVYQKA
jgi:hypothetical protein